MTIFNSHVKLPEGNQRFNFKHVERLLESNGLSENVPSESGNWSKTLQKCETSQKIRSYDVFFFASEFPIHPLDRHFPHGHDGELYLTEGPHPLHTGDWRGAWTSKKAGDSWGLQSGGHGMSWVSPKKIDKLETCFSPKTKFAVEISGLIDLGLFDNVLKHQHPQVISDI